MEEKSAHPHYPTNWGMRFLCECRKQNERINIHKGIAHELSIHGVHILSDHHICEHKKVAMQLMIPSLLNGAPQKIIKIIGNSIATVVNEGKFLTEIVFLHFEEDGLKELDRNLHRRFGTQAFAHTPNLSWQQNNTQ